MVSEEHRRIEQIRDTNQVTHDEFFVQAIAHRLKKDTPLIDRACYLASVATGSRPLDVILCINEFLAALHEEPGAGEFLS